MYDVLPRIGICEEIFDISKIDYFLLPSLEKRFQKETLDMLNVPKEKRLSSKTYRHIVGSEIITTQHPYCLKNATYDITNIPVWISQWLKEKYLKTKDDKNDTPKKVYIDRSDSESNIKKLRSIINEKEVKEFLKNRGFEFISLGHFSFKEQIKIMNNAEIVVGLHGAGFANFCFCKPKTKVIEITPNTAGKMYENLALSNDLNYKSVNCDPIGVNYHNQLGHIKVSIDTLKKTIESFN